MDVRGVLQEARAAIPTGVVRGYQPSVQGGASAGHLATTQAVPAVTSCPDHAGRKGKVYASIRISRMGL